MQKCELISDNLSCKTHFWRICGPWEWPCTLFIISCQLAMALLQLQSYSNVSGTPSAVFAALISLLLWMHCSSCYQVFSLRHSPGITLLLSSSRSIAAFWITGYLMRMRLWQQMAEMIISLAIFGWNFMTHRRQAYLLASIPKAFSQNLLQWLVL